MMFQFTWIYINYIQREWRVLWSEWCKGLVLLEVCSSWWQYWKVLGILNCIEMGPSARVPKPLEWYIIRLVLGLLCSSSGHVITEGASLALPVLSFSAHSVFLLTYTCPPILYLQGTLPFGCVWPENLELNKLLSFIGSLYQMFHYSHEISLLYERKRRWIIYDQRWLHTGYQNNSEIKGSL